MGVKSMTYVTNAYIKSSLIKHNCGGAAMGDLHAPTQQHHGRRLGAAMERSFGGVVSLRGEVWRGVALSGIKMN